MEKEASKIRCKSKQIVLTLRRRGAENNRQILLKKQSEFDERHLCFKGKTF